MCARKAVGSLTEAAHVCDSFEKITGKNPTQWYGHTKKASG